MAKNGITIEAPSPEGRHEADAIELEAGLWLQVEDMEECGVEIDALDNFLALRAALDSTRFEDNCARLSLSDDGLDLSGPRHVAYLIALECLPEHPYRADKAMETCA